MHVLLGAALLAALTAFAFGEGVARVFVGMLLATGAGFVLLVVVHSAQGVSESQAKAAAIHAQRGYTR